MVLQKQTALSGGGLVGTKAVAKIPLFKQGDLLNGDLLEFGIIRGVAAERLSAQGFLLRPPVGTVGLFGNQAGAFGHGF